jgi:hypothetical protein
MALFWVVLFSAVAAISSAEASFYNNGVCYGPSHNGVPDLAIAISHYRKFGLTRIRLMEYDEYDVGALHAMGFEVSFGVNNDELQTLASSYGAVEDWFEKKVENIIKYDYFVINYIVVGDEAIPGPLAQYVLPVVASLIRLFQSKNKPHIQVIYPFSVLFIQFLFINYFFFFSFLFVSPIRANLHCRVMLNVIPCFLCVSLKLIWLLKLLLNQNLIVIYHKSHSFFFFFFLS